MADDSPMPGVPLQTKLIGLGIVLALAGFTAYLVIASSRERPLDHPYDIGEREVVDPNLITWHQVDAWPLELKAPRCLSVAGDGAVLVGGEHRLIVHDREGGVRKQIALAHSPTAIAVDEAGRILVAQRTLVTVYDANGGDHGLLADFGDKAVITAIAIADDGILYLADAGNKLVWQCDGNGTVMSRIAEPRQGVEDTGLLLPEKSLDVSWADGHLHVVNAGKLRIEAYEPDGDRVGTYGRSGSGLEHFAGCHNPTALVATSQGYFTAEKGICRVKELDVHGDLRGVVAAPSDFDDTNAVVDMALDGTGRLLLLDSSRSEVRIFAAKAEAKPSD